MEDIDALSVKRGSNYPKASDHVGDMIEITHELLHKGFAYENMGRSILIFPNLKITDDFQVSILERFSWAEQLI